MKFRDIRGFTTGDVTDWVKRELGIFLKQLRFGLTRLTFADNFESFEATVKTTAGVELAIKNELPFIPTRFLLLSSNHGVCHRGATYWTDDYLYINGSATADDTLTIVFLR